MLRLDSNILWTIINLLILYVIARKFLFGPVRKVLAARQAEIDKQFADARTAQEDAQKLKEQYQESLDGAEKERLDILNQARDRAGEEYERILSEAKALRTSWWRMPKKVRTGNRKSVSSRPRSRLRTWWWRPLPSLWLPDRVRKRIESFIINL